MNRKWILNELCWRKRKNKILLCHHVEKQIKHKNKTKQILRLRQYNSGYHRENITEVAGSVRNM